MRLIWSNEKESLPATFGLELAHYLGYYFCKDFYKQDSENSITNLLSESNFHSFSGEINSLWLNDIGEKTIKDWRKNTGLKLNKQ